MTSHGHEPRRDPLSGIECSPSDTLSTPVPSPARVETPEGAHEWKRRAEAAEAWAREQSPEERDVRAEVTRLRAKASRALVNFARAVQERETVEVERDLARARVEGLEAIYRVVVAALAGEVIADDWLGHPPVARAVEVVAALNRANAATTRAEAERDQQAGALGTLREALEACADLLDDYADVDDGDDGHPRPNRAMSLLREVEAALAASAPPPSEEP